MAVARTDWPKGARTADRSSVVVDTATRGSLTVSTTSSDWLPAVSPESGTKRARTGNAPLVLEDSVVDAVSDASSATDDVVPWKVNSTDPSTGAPAEDTLAVATVSSPAPTTVLVRLRTVTVGAGPGAGTTVSDCGALALAVCLLPAAGTNLATTARGPTASEPMAACAEPSTRSRRASNATWPAGVPLTLATWAVATTVPLAGRLLRDSPSVVTVAESGAWVTVTVRTGELLASWRVTSAGTKVATTSLSPTARLASSTVAEPSSRSTSCWVAPWVKRILPTPTPRPVATLAVAVTTSVVCAVRRESARVVALATAGALPTTSDAEPLELPARPEPGAGTNLAVIV